MRKQLADLLPLSMLPARYERHTRLPRMPSGKVDRLALAQVPLEVKGSPTDEKRGDSLASLKKSAAPDLSSVRANAIENTVIAIWREVLGDVQIRADSGFFEIGGDSLQAMRVCSRLSAVTGIEIGLRAFFDTPKLGQLVEKLTSAGSHGRSVG
jgi:acyl carrier protein